MDTSTWIETARSWLTDLWAQATEIWTSGGWAMIAIALTALILFGMGMHIHMALGRKGFLRVSEETWRRWVAHPPERKGTLGRMLDEVTTARTIDEASALFEQVRTREVAPFERDLRVMKTCVSAAPLLGLLGTVTGMLVTFGALSTGSGGDQTMAMVAGGISEALVTTETGLVIALPGLFFQYQLTRKHERYKAFLAHVESVCSQAIHKGQLHAGTAA